MLFVEVLSRDPAFAAAVRTKGGITKGTTGAQVQLVQLGMLAAGLKLPRSTKDMSKVPDGIFGQETFESICAFQRSSRLAVDGIVGPLTVKAVSSAIPGNPIPDRHRCGCSRGQVAVSGLLGSDFRSVRQTTGCGRGRGSG